MFFDGAHQADIIDRKYIAAHHIKNQEHLCAPATDALDAHQVLDHVIVRHVRPAARIDQLVVEVPRQILEVIDLAAGKPAGAHRIHLHREDGGWRDCVRSINQAVPHRLRGLHRDLLADDGARQCRERIAARAQIGFGVLLDQAAHQLAAFGEIAAGSLPVVGGHILSHRCRITVVVHVNDGEFDSETLLGTCI